MWFSCEIATFLCHLFGAFIFNLKVFFLKNSNHSHSAPFKRNVFIYKKTQETRGMLGICIPERSIIDIYVISCWRTVSVSPLKASESVCYFLCRRLCDFLLWIFLLKMETRLSTIKSCRYSHDMMSLHLSSSPLFPLLLLTSRHAWNPIIFRICFIMLELRSMLNNAWRYRPPSLPLLSPAICTKWFKVDEVNG